jgi:hypothetical protein
MKIISFDVGIKNLACCVLDVCQENSHESKILYWDVLNLTNPTIYPPCCMDSCKQKVKHFLHDTQNYYCTRHSKKNTNAHIILPEELYLAKLKKISQKELFLKATEFNLEPKKPISKKQLLSMIEIYIQGHYLIPIPPEKKASEMDLISVGKQMYWAFKNKLQCFEPYDYVIIENQISPIANRMKTVQGMIAYHFIMRNPTSHIHFISASNKLNTFTDDKIENYGDRKKASVDISKQLLCKYNTFSEYKNYLDKNGKKDDLADCFLQLLYFAKLHNMIDI